MSGRVIAASGYAQLRADGVDKASEQTLKRLQSAWGASAAAGNRWRIGLQPFYKLLAIGRSVLIISEPDAEAALTVSENRLGCVVTPGDACELAKTIRFASSSKEIIVDQRASGRNCIAIRRRQRVGKLPEPGRGRFYKSAMVGEE